MGIVDTKTPGYEPMARLVIYTSNIFAVLGLRSLFFLLRGAVSKFDYLQQGIAYCIGFYRRKNAGRTLDQSMDRQTGTGIYFTGRDPDLYQRIDFLFHLYAEERFPSDIEDNSI